MPDSKTKVYEQEGEKIITSAGYDDLDLESIVEPSELAPEEIEEEHERLAVRATLVFKFYFDNSSNKAAEKTIEGELVRYHHAGRDVEVVCLKASVEDALYIANINRHLTGTKEVDLKMSYVLNEEPAHMDLYKEKRVFRLDGIEFGDVERSRCDLSVKLSRVT